MECEIVERLLALNEIAPDDRDAVNGHVASCDACRRAALLYSGINEALAAEPAWHPPTGLASDVVTIAPVSPIWTARNWFATVAAFALLLAAFFLVIGQRLYVQSALFQNYVAAVSIVSRALVKNAVFIVLGFATTFAIATAWLTRRWLVKP
jgi:hypothetical protein